MATLDEVRLMKSSKLATEAQKPREIPRTTRIDLSDMRLEIYVANGGPNDGKIYVRARAADQALDVPAERFLEPETVAVLEEVRQRAYLALGAEE